MMLYSLPTDWVLLELHVDPSQDVFVHAWERLGHMEAVVRDRYLSSCGGSYDAVCCWVMQELIRYTVSRPAGSHGQDSVQVMITITGYTITQKAYPLQVMFLKSTVIYKSKDD